MTKKYVLRTFINIFCLYNSFNQNHHILVKNNTVLLFFPHVVFYTSSKIQRVLSFSWGFSYNSWSEKCPSSESLLSKLTTRLLLTAGAAAGTARCAAAGAAAAPSTAGSGAASATSCTKTSGGATIGIARDFLCGSGCCCFCWPAPAPAGAAEGAAGADGEPGFMRELHHLWKPLPLSGPLGIRITLGGKARPDTASSACPKRRGGLTRTGCIIIIGDSMGMYLMLGPPLERRPLCCCGGYC